MGYEQIRVTGELSRSVQRALGISTLRRETLGDLVKAMSAEQRVRRLEGLVSEETTRHEVRVDGRVMHTFCFVDALMLPFLLRGVAIEVRSDSPTGGK